MAIAAYGLSASGLEPGKDFAFAVMGIDPKDKPRDAKAMKDAQLAPYPALEAAAYFLNGDASAIASVTKALNYTPVYDVETDEYAHPVGAVILTPDGRVSRVMSGLNLNPDAFRAALIGARENTLSSLVEGIRLLCYGHSPLHGAYASTIRAALAAGGLLDSRWPCGRRRLFCKEGRAPIMSGLRLFPEEASTQAPATDTLFLILMIVSASIIILVVCAHHRLLSALPPRDQGKPRTASRHRIARIRDRLDRSDAVRLSVPVLVGGPAQTSQRRCRRETRWKSTSSAKQWMWKTQHPNGAREINSLHVPGHEPVRLVMTSEDVIHSFYVPDFRIKQDMLPGRYTETWFNADQDRRLFICSARSSAAQNIRG